MAVTVALSVAPQLVESVQRVAKARRYRPDPWLWPEWAVAGGGLLAAIVFNAGQGYDPAALNPALYPSSALCPMWIPIEAVAQITARPGIESGRLKFGQSGGQTLRLPGDDK